MIYETKNYENLIGLPGFSEPLLKNHIALYQGYVNNTNKLIDMLTDFAKDGVGHSELKRRFGWEWNGMQLHEYYFENLSKEKNQLDINSDLYKKIVESFSSYENWEKDFKAVGALRGIGWVILYYDPIGRKLFNTWINEHDGGHLSGAKPILVMDVFEHAFMIDYGIKKMDYIEAFFKVINWNIVNSRF
ncbi:MAG: superoxide dismutase [Patescibacteria group bacterium]|nr:superoxide dismutase [Patescibacteria group bacterium]